MDKRLSFKKMGDDRFFVCISKDSPKNLYENIKIYYAIQYLFFHKKINTDMLNEHPIKIILKYDDKDLFFYFDKNLYDDLLKTMDQICQIQDRLRDNQDVISLIDKNDVDIRKCEHCFFMSQCRDKNS